MRIYESKSGGKGNDGNQREWKREKLLNGYFADGANDVIRMPSNVVNLPNGNLGVSKVFYVRKSVRGGGGGRNKKGMSRGASAMAKHKSVNINSGVCVAAEAFYLLESDQSSALNSSSSSLSCLRCQSSVWVMSMMSNMLGRGIDL
jgi:hypothetical protein